MTISKKEQELLIEMFMNPDFCISANGQKIYNSSWFYDVVCNLKNHGLIRSLKNGRKKIYKLTEEGLLFGYILSKEKGNKKEIYYDILYFH